MLALALVPRAAGSGGPPSRRGVPDGDPVPRKRAREVKESKNAGDYPDQEKLKSTWVQRGGTQTQQFGECPAGGGSTGAAPPHSLVWHRSRGTNVP